MTSETKKTLAKEIIYFFSAITLLLLIWAGIEIRNKVYENKINSFKKEISEFQLQIKIFDKKLSEMVIKFDEYGIPVKLIPPLDGKVVSEKNIDQPNILLNNVYIAFINGGYKGNKSDFILLIKENPEALNDAYKLSLNLGFKKGIKEFYSSIISEFKNEQTLTKTYQKKIEILNKSKNSTNKNFINYKQKYLSCSEIKNNLFYCFIILFGFLYPVRLIYKLLKWSFLTLEMKNNERNN